MTNEEIPITKADLERAERATYEPKEFMTLNEIIKKIPEDLRDSKIFVNVPCIQPGDEDEYPVSSITLVLDQTEIKIILDVKVY